MPASQEGQMAVLKGNSESVNQVSKVVPGPWGTPVATRDKRPPRAAPSMLAGWLREAFCQATAGARKGSRGRNSACRVQGI